MTLSIRATTRNARADLITTAIGVGGKIVLYGGSVPADADAAASSTVLAQCSLHPSNAFAPAASSGSFSASAYAGETYVARDDSADASGVITHIRILDSSNNCIFQEDDVGTSGTAVIVSNTSTTSGQPIEVNSVSWTEGNA
jgi:hypothetical protein